MKKINRILDRVDILNIEKKKMMIKLKILMKTLRFMMKNYQIKTYYSLKKRSIIMKGRSLKMIDFPDQCIHDRITTRILMNS